MTGPVPSGGARRAGRPSPGKRAPAGLGALAVVVAAGLLVWAAPSRPDHPPTVDTAAQGAAVRSTTLGCPAADQHPAGVSTAYGLGSARSTGLGSDGTITTTPAGDVPRRGAVAVTEAPSSQGLAVRGTEALAQGLFAWRADTGSSVAVTSCAIPRASWWFTGAGTSVTHMSYVTLSNLESGPVMVDLRVIAADGEVDVSQSGGAGIAIAPGTSTTLDLAALVPAADELGVWVHATRGRVVAAVHDAFSGRTGVRRGTEWLPSVAEPDRVVRLAGVPAGASLGTLLVANPTQSEAVVSVEIDGPSGRFVPPDLQSISVAPGALVSSDLTGVVDARSFAVRLRSSVPIVATMRSTMADSEESYAGMADVLTAPAAAPVVGSTSVQLTAGPDTARATVVAYDESGKALRDHRFSLAARSTGAWVVPQGASYVVVEPGQGEVFGATVHDAASAVPLQALPISVQVPAVRPIG